MNQYGPQDPEFRLTPPFESIPFACCTVNLGPQTITPLHLDSENLSYGICVISSFGKYDWRKGGELFLLEPNVLLQMRPGDVVLMPSALITHGNMPLSSPSEVRYSITMYSAGRLFECWYCWSKESNKKKSGKLGSNIIISCKWKCLTLIFMAHRQYVFI